MTAITRVRRRDPYLKLVRWLDSDYFPGGASEAKARPKELELDRVLPFLVLHLACLGVIWVGWSPAAVIMAAAFYAIRMFAVTAFYHRYFSHRTFKTTRFMQFCFALLAASCAQRGPLWWASHHRHHHLASDEPEDLHSVRQRGFWWAHMGWIMCTANMPTHYERIRDFAKFPELMFLNRFDWLPPILLGVGMLLFGNALAHYWPELGTSGPQMLVWGFFISTVLLFHGTCTINSLSHVYGKKRFNTTDDSKNNFFLALVTFGEGWHNNHHRYPGSVRQGFYWWEVDMTYYILRAMAAVGLIYDLHPVPQSIYQEADRLKLSNA